MTFPQLDLPPRQHAATRGVLVGQATRHRRPRRFLVPVVAALAVVAVAVGAFVAAGRWISADEPPTTTPGRARCNDTRPGTRSDAKGLTYVLDVPKGWTAKASIDLVLYCAEPRPVVEYGGGQNSVRVFRGFSTRTAAMAGPLPATATRENLSPLGPDGYGGAVRVPYRPVDVGGVQGRLIRHDTVAWQVAGAWWTVVGDQELGVRRLTQIATELRFHGDQVSWPTAEDKGFQPASPEPTLADLPEGSWQPVWNLCLMERPGPCSIVLRAARWNWWSPAGDLNTPQEEQIVKRFNGSGGGGWTTPKGVVWRSWYGPDTSVYRKADGSTHFVALDSEEVTMLLRPRS